MQRYYESYVALCIRQYRFLLFIVRFFRCLGVKPADRTLKGVKPVTYLSESSKEPWKIARFFLKAFTSLVIFSLFDCHWKIFVIL